MIEAAASGISFPARLVRAVRRNSLSGFLKLCLVNAAALLSGRWKQHSYVYDDAFDREHGVDTAGVVEVDELVADSSSKTSAERYEATPPECFTHLLDEAQIGDRSGYHFVDLGSGKGRTLLLAQLAGFRTVTGVELCEELHRIALANMERKWPACSGALPRPLHGDATSYPFPPEPTVCFLNNPFGPPVLEKALDNIEQSLRAAPRDFVLLYYHCNHADVLEARAGWRCTRRGHWQNAAHHYAIYKWDAREAP
jgi:predicted RNA methylase